MGDLLVTKRRTLIAPTGRAKKRGRKESDEEIMQACKLALGSIKMSINPKIYFPEKFKSTFIQMRGQAITVSEIKNAGMVYQICDAIHKSLKHLPEWLEWVKTLDQKS